MNLTFKRFCAHLDEMEVSTPIDKEDLNEIFGKFFGKNKKAVEDDEDDNDSVSKKKETDPKKILMTKKKEELQKKKDAEDEYRKKLRKAADDKWAASKKHIESNFKHGKSDRDDYALHRNN